MLNFTKLLILSTILLNLTSLTSANANEDFPGRTTYKKVPYITVEDLYKKKDDVIIIDTRSDYEYDTLSIKGAINIPLSNIDFSKRIKALYKKEKKTLVFYCNGHSCMKSYRAVIKTKRLTKITDSFAFDAGIYDWAKHYPHHSVLLGKSPINVADLIPKNEFANHLLKPEAFVKKADRNCLVLDVRDPTQRLDRLFPGNQHSVSLNKSEQTTLNKYLDKSKKENRPLCIYDAVGKQVRWLQYHLKAKNISNYFFMEGGAKAYYDMS